MPVATYIVFGLLAPSDTLLDTIVITTQEDVGGSEASLEDCAMDCYQGLEQAKAVKLTGQQAADLAVDLAAKSTWTLLAADLSTLGTTSMYDWESRLNAKWPDLEIAVK